MITPGLSSSLSAIGFSFKIMSSVSVSASYTTFMTDLHIFHFTCPIHRHNYRRTPVDINDNAVKILLWRFATTYHRLIYAPTGTDFQFLLRLRYDCTNVRLREATPSHFK